jgi:hypothetical protein
LAVYQQRHDLENAAAAALLGCDLAALTHLRLCRRPGAAMPQRTAEEDVQAIAGRFACDAGTLPRILDYACPAKG